VWIIAVATFRVGSAEGWFSNRAFWVVAGVVFVALLVASFFGGKEEEAPARQEKEFDAFAGGYPVPPMPGQQLPELAGVLTGVQDDDLGQPVERAAGSGSAGGSRRASSRTEKDGTNT
jgi:NADH-quinone oxidoreductase subunit H